MNQKGFYVCMNTSLLLKTNQQLKKNPIYTIQISFQVNFNFQRVLKLCKPS